MTASIMKEWLLEFNAKMVRQNRKICLLLDNATSHPKISLSNINMIFLQPKTTASLQPLDQGIIHCFKMHYRKRVLLHLINQMGNAVNASQLSSTINCLDVIYWLTEATKAIPKSCVANCFRKAGIGSEIFAEDPDNLGELSNLVEFENGLSMAEYVAIDDDVHTENDDEFAEFHPSDSDDDGIDDQNDEADGSLYPQNATPMSSNDVLKNLYAMKEFATDLGKTNLLNHLMASIKIIEEDLTQKIKQAKIDNYFYKL